MILKIGFTGTQWGMTDQQKMRVEDLISYFNESQGQLVVEAHHGDCVGADDDFHDLADNWNLDVVIHPPKDDKKRAFCHSPEIRRPKPYLERNRDIVKECSVLIACPGGEEHRRSGTWSTIRNARTKIYDHLPMKIYVIMPGGEVREEGSWWE